MKVTYTPEDREEQHVYDHARDWLSALQSVDNYLRGQIKYGELPEPVSEALQAARARLHEELGSLDLWGC